MKNPLDMVEQFAKRLEDIVPNVKERRRFVLAPEYPEIMQAVYDGKLIVMHHQAGDLEVRIVG